MSQMPSVKAERALANRAQVRKLSGCGSQHPPPRSHACLPQPVGQTGSAGCAGPGETDLLIADGLGPDCCVISVKSETGYLLISGHV